MIGTAGTAPRLLSVTRLTTLFVSILVSLSSGSNYVRYVYFDFGAVLTSMNLLWTRRSFLVSDPTYPI